MGKGLLSIRGLAIGIATPSLAISALIGACSGFQGESENAQGVDASGGDAAPDQPADAAEQDGAADAAISPPKGCGDAAVCRRIFVTSTKFQGDFGASQANGICYALAADAGLGGSWTAWISSGSDGARERLNATGSWYANGEEAIRIPEKMNEAIQALRTLTRNERGEEIGGGELVWTGTGGQGATVNGYTCTNWTRVDASAAFGDPTQVSVSWTYAGRQGCGSMAHLYCFEQ